MTIAAAAVAALRPSLAPVRSHRPSLAPDDFAMLLAACESHRLLGLLAKAVRDGAVTLTSEQHEQLRSRRTAAWLTHSLRVERLLLDATAALDEAGIASRVLKGVALAHTAYDDPSERVFGDVDLLVPGDRFTRSAEVLASRDSTANAPQPELRRASTTGSARRSCSSVGALELDLHRTFVEGAYGLTVDLDDLFAPPYRFPLGVTELEALADAPAAAARELRGCVRRLAAAADVAPRRRPARAPRASPTSIDVLLMAREWQCEPIVARAVNLAWDELQLTSEPPIVEWARRFEPTALSAADARLARGAGACVHAVRSRQFWCCGARPPASPTFGPSCFHSGRTSRRVASAPPGTSGARGTGSCR